MAEQGDFALSVELVVSLSLRRGRAGGKVENARVRKVVFQLEAGTAA